MIGQSVFHGTRVRPVTGRRMAEMKRFCTTSIGRTDQLDICIDEISPYLFTV
jgi:hypothetical protein